MLPFIGNYQVWSLEKNLEELGKNEKEKGKRKEEHMPLTFLLHLLNSQFSL